LNSPIPVAIALGSNLGDRQRHLASARARLSALLDAFCLSSFYETEPVGVSMPQGAFLNAAGTGTTTLAPEALLDRLQAIEREHGRMRPFANAPRTLDLDLILYGELIVNGPSLTVPHPRFRDRRFVLAPLAEIAADWRDPVTHLTVADLLARLPPEPRAPRR
jgi:2-amino-4-hydroxy-6-hydroxymethyldihydropteridine diphosphokinase